MQETPKQGPRLRIGHLMIWVVGLAIGLALSRPSLSRDYSDARIRTFVIVSALVSALALGTTLAGCGLLAYRRWHGDASCPSRAGHWLMLRALAIYAALMPIHWGWPGLSFPVSLWIILLIDLGFLWHLRHRLPRHWVAVFLASAIMVGIQATAMIGSPYPGFLASAIDLVGDLLEAVLIARAIVLDRRAGAPADGLHHLGAAMVLALDLYGPAFRVAWSFG